MILHDPIGQKSAYELPSLYKQLWSSDKRIIFSSSWLIIFFFPKTFFHLASFCNKLMYLCTLKNNFFQHIRKVLHKISLNMHTEWLSFAQVCPFVALLYSCHHAAHRFYYLTQFFLPSFVLFFMHSAWCMVIGHSASVTNYNWNTCQPIRKKKFPLNFFAECVLGIKKISI